MFNWVCPRCGHDVPPSKTECPFCFPPAPEAHAAPAPVPQPPQFQPPQYQQPPQYAQPVQQQPPQYVQQQAPPQYWQPQTPPPPQYQQAPPAPQQYAPPQQYGQQAPPQYWQPQAPPQYQPVPPPHEQPPAYQAPYQPAPPVQQYQPPAPPPVQEPQYAQPQTQPPPQPVHYEQSQYVQPTYVPPVAERKAPETAPTPWPPPEEKTGKPLWMIATLTVVGFLALFGAAYFLMGSHGSSAKDAAATQKAANPLQKDIEIVGIRIVSANNGQAAKFVVVNHSGVELTDVGGNVSLWASTSRSEEDAVGSFAFRADSIKPGESKELTAPLKSDKQAFEMPDWHNITADVQITTP